MALSIKVKKEELGDDPPIATYHVTLTGERGVWTERYTRSELDAFLRGVRAGADVFGGKYINEPEIPR
jgi:hypothetical protein